MAKNRNKKKKSGAVAMDTTEPSVSHLPQAMDISGSVIQNQAFLVPDNRIKKGRSMKRSKNVRKMKARAKAISINEKTVEKVLKTENKTVRIHSAKLLYD